jgi:predicted transcriptional regulator
VLLSSSLLEAFEPDELKFVVGHELGHHLFGHHTIPVGTLLSGTIPIGPGLALQLFAWQRYAEISSDRAGLYCAGGFDGAARALFKLASGLRGGRIRILIDKFVSQVTDLRDEAQRQARADEPMRSDWFSTHPFSPLRLRAAELFAASDLLVPGGMSRDTLEAQVHELMTLMDPSYLTERSEAAEAMRRLLFAGAMLMATTSAKPNERTIEELEKLLGPGSVPMNSNRNAIQEDLPNRIARVKDVVPVLRRTQVVRDLCIMARADGRADAAELRLLVEIADAIGVEREIVRCTAAAANNFD